MKKSIFVLSLLLPLSVQAQAPAAITQAPPPAAAAVTKKQETTIKGISSLDLKDAKLSLDLTAEQIKLSGSLPKECADRLSLSDVQRHRPSKSPDELKDAALEKVDQLKDYSSTIEVQITYSSDDKNPTIRDCLANNTSSEGIDLSKDPRFSRTVSLSPELAIAGIFGEPMLLKSPEYIKMEREIQKLDCKDCNSSWKLLSAHLTEARGFDSPLLSSMMSKLFEGSLSEMGKKIDSVTDLAALERIRDQLVEMGAFATTNDQHQLENALFIKLIEKNNLLASAGLKTSSMATRHADFNKDTYSKMLSIPGLPEEQRDALKEKAAAMAPGQPERLQFLSKIDGNHPEIQKFLRESEESQRDLQMKIQNTCMGRMNQYRFTQCGELQKQYFTNQQSTSELQSRFTLADNQNWNNIFTFWDKNNISYNQNWHTSFIKPTMQNLPNSLPDMYDPKDKRYQNFDPSKLYQTNTVMPQMNPLFSAQPYSVTPLHQ